MIDPKQFKSVTAYRLAKAQQSGAREFWRKFRRFVGLAALAVALILAFINWPGETLACVVVGACIAALVGGLWLGQAVSADREHDEEQNI